MGRLVPENHIDVLIRAYQQLRTDKKCVIVGHAPYADEYIKQVRRKVKVSCAKQCVVMKKEKKKLRPDYVVKRGRRKNKRAASKSAKTCRRSNALPAPSRHRPERPKTCALIWRRWSG